MFGNYTGPYWSDGKYQESVEFGESEPVDALDALSRYHDTAYAHWSDDRHRRAADRIYNEDASVLSRSGDRHAEAARLAVKYGNDLGSRAGSYLTYGPLGPLKAGLDLGSDLYEKLTQGEMYKKEKAEIREYFKKDPKLARKAMTSVDVVDSRGPFGFVSHQPTGMSGHVLEAPADSVAVRNSNRIVPDKTNPDEYVLLPTGKYVRRKRAKRVAPLLVPIKPSHRLADVVESETYRNAAAKPLPGHVVRNGFDLTWNVNPLKMKRNKVKPRL